MSRLALTARERLKIAQRLRALRFRLVVTA
jgi:hypothetical protein